MNTAFSVIEPVSLNTEITEIIYCEELNKVLIITTQLTSIRSEN